MKPIGDANRMIVMNRVLPEIRIKHRFIVPASVNNASFIYSAINLMINSTIIPCMIDDMSALYCKVLLERYGIHYLIMFTGIISNDYKKPYYEDWLHKTLAELQKTFAHTNGKPCGFNFSATAAAQQSYKASDFLVWFIDMFAILVSDQYITIEAYKRSLDTATTSPNITHKGMQATSTVQTKCHAVGCSYSTPIDSITTNVVDIFARSSAICIGLHMLQAINTECPECKCKNIAEIQHVSIDISTTALCFRIISTPDITVSMPSSLCKPDNSKLCIKGIIRMEGNQNIVMLQFETTWFEIKDDKIAEVALSFIDGLYRVVGCQFVVYDSQHTLETQLPKCDVCMSVVDDIANPIVQCHVRNCSAVHHLTCIPSFDQCIPNLYAEYICPKCASQSVDDCSESSDKDDIICQMCQKSSFPTTMIRCEPPKDNRFVHPSCGLWQTNSLFDEDGCCRNLDHALQNAKSMRKKDKTFCLICFKDRGLLVKCNDKNCNNSYHVSCALNSKTTIVFAKLNSVESDKYEYWTFCDLHIEAFLYHLDQQPATRLLSSSVQIQDLKRFVHNREIEGKDHIYAIKEKRLTVPSVFEDEAEMSDGNER